MSRRRIAYATAIAALMAGAILAAPTAAARFNPKPPAPKTLAVERAAYIAPVTYLAAVKITRPNGLGSGFHIGSGLVVTAAHVVSGAKTVSIKDAQGKTGMAEIVAIDEANDVAVMRTRHKMLATEIDCGTVDVGSDILAVGMPLGQEFITSYGRIAGAPRDLHGRKVYVTDMTTIMGQSGSGVWSGGRVIGVTSAAMVAPFELVGRDVKEGNGIYAQSVVGFGYVVPSSVACALVAGLEGEGA